MAELAHNQYFNGVDVFGGADPTVAPSKNIIPRFFKDFRLNQAKSQDAGRQVFDEIEMVEYLIGGDKYNQPVMRVTDIIRRRFPNEYAAFKRGEEISLTGTPVEMAPWLNRHQVLMLKAVNVMTVEQLAEANEQVINSIGMGARTLVKQAQAWLENAKTGAAPVALVTEAEQAKAEVERLRRIVEEQAAQIQTIGRENDTLKAGRQSAPAELSGDTGLVPERSNPDILGTFQGIEIPRNWRTMHHKAMMSLASKISMAAILNKEDAVNALEQVERELTM